MKLVALLWTIPLALCLSAAASGDDLGTPGDPKGLGFSAARLARIPPWYQARFDSLPPSEGLVPGAVVAIAKDGKLAYLQAIGFQDKAKTIPMKTDSIFMIASMSKPVTSVAAMILVDDGKLDLDAPVARYLPELRDMRVVSLKTDPGGRQGEWRLDPQKRPMTVRDLLRHTSGLIYPELDFAYPQRGLEDPTADLGIRMLHMLYRETPVYRRDKTLADFVSSLAGLPLAHQPGEVWEYGYSADVLGRVVEVASGQPFDQFLQSRLFAPLHMVDTGFYVPKAKLDRLVDAPTPERWRIWDMTTPAKLFSGGGGLVSTATDYLRFCQMLLNGGELDGARVLTPETVKLMTTNALPPDVSIFGEEIGPRAGRTFGLGFAIRADPVSSYTPGAVGSFSWAGLWGTQFWIDPTEKLIGLQMIQAAPGKGRAGVPFAGVRHLVYGAMTIPEPPSSTAPAAIVGPETLADYAGSYDFGASVSSRDVEGLAPDYKTGWFGIESFAMERGGLRIDKPDHDGPAAKAGAVAGDLITELDDAPLAGLPLADVMAKLRGPANTTIKVRVVHAGQSIPNDISVVRGARRPGVNAVELRVRVEQGKLVAEATGAWPILEFENGKATPLVATSSSEFTVDDEDHTRIAFVRDAAGKVSGLVLNPGPWEQKATLIPPGPS